ncbi:hypothetical protein [Streptomyces sp. ST2-7A]|uniref:hypothetical protein n=1 Tax=Streptomyces sp. ST2-7A TaxID=2907214 RepID=UPI001F358AC6|nr:hypothetical protein [Streptomyces sp. ST2-7A]MCE7081158.1 hypothetical protein [Streptomyces sp. ST2-7A]
MAPHGQAVMLAVANTRVTVLHAVGEPDDYTGEVPEQPAAEPVPAARAERSRSIRDPRTGTWRQIPETVWRLPHGTLARVGDRLRDETTGKVHPIFETREHLSFGHAGDLICTTRRTDRPTPLPEPPAPP